VRSFSKSSSGESLGIALPFSLTTFLIASNQTSSIGLFEKSETRGINVGVVTGCNIRNRILECFQVFVNIDSKTELPLTLRFLIQCAH